MSSSKGNGSRRWTLASGASVLAAAAATALSAAPALAQDADEEAIIVTGSRIPQANLYTTSPVTQVTSEDIQTQGVTRIEDLTNELPQVFAAQGSNISNGASGTAEVDLRGLGPDRTLVLINGRRMGYGSPNSTAADLNQIPGALVERVEVLTGGASAVYGSDAVSGVVNFIMTDDFEGMRMDAQWGVFTHHNDYDGPGNLRNVIAGRAVTNPSEYRLPPDDVTEGIGKEITFVVGVSSPDNRGNITAYAGYRRNDAVLQSQYDYSACTIGTTEDDNIGPNFLCGGSSTSARGRFTDFGLVNLTLDPAVGDVGIGSGGFRPYRGSRDAYNFGPLNYYQRPDERYTLGAFARYEINPHVEAYAQMMHSDYRSDAQIAPSGDFGNTSTINCGDTALLSPAQFAAICESDRVEDIVDDPATSANEVQRYIDAVINGGGTMADALQDIAESIGDQTCLTDDPANPVDAPVVADPNDCPLSILRRNVEGGPRDDDMRFQTYRMVGGIRGPMAGGWEYDLSASYSRVDLSRVYRNELSVTRLKRALDVIADPGTGDPVCRSVVDGSDTSCVPYNIFSPGGVTAAALNYLQVPFLQHGDATQQNIIGVVTGEGGLTSPLAESPIAASFGVEYRRDSLDQIADPGFQAGDGAGQGSQTLPLSGSSDVFEIFGEARVPLIEGLAAADLVALDLAYRFSSYGSGIETDTYKIGLEWAPTADVRVRLSNQHAVRAANIIELYAQQSPTLFDMAYDPCDANNRPAADGPVPSTCIGTNPWQVTPAQSLGAGLDSPAGQYTQFSGGNPSLEPENSDTITLGVVVTPTFLPDLVFSVDYFKIEVNDLISTTGPLNTLSDCYDNGTASSCARITRDPSTGQLWLGAGMVEDLNLNIGGYQTAGVDLNANYSLDLGEHQLSFGLVGTWLDELTTDPGLTGADPYNCAGNFGSVCGSPNPEWRHRFRTTWSSPWNLDVSLTWRYMGEVQQVNASNEALDAGLERVFDAENYFDISGNYQLLENTKLRFGVNNVLDNDPPLSGRSGSLNGNTYPQVYDSLGRWVFAGLTVDW